jgi:NADPH:quinone reductase-like Zn-dependent oxidoreductase
VGGDYLPASVECCAPLGRVILIGLMAGRSATVNLGSVLSKRVTVRGTQMRGRNPEEKAAVTEAFARDVLPLLENGKATPVIEKVFPLEKIADAHTLLESNETFGKVVISMSS